MSDLIGITPDVKALCKRRHRIRNRRWAKHRTVLRHMHRFWERWISSNRKSFDDRGCLAEEAKFAMIVRFNPGYWFSLKQEQAQ